MLVFVVVPGTKTKTKLPGMKDNTAQDTMFNKDRVAISLFYFSVLQNPYLVS